MRVDRFQEDQQIPFRNRVGLLGAIATALFMLLFLRFYYLQVIRGKMYQELADNNRLALVRIKAPRGIISDRNGKPIVNNRPSFNVSLVMEDVVDVAGTENILASTLGVDAATLHRKIGRVDRYRKYEPILVKADITRSDLVSLETKKSDYPGISIEVDPRRTYAQGALAAHLIGFVGEINRDELEERKNAGYRSGDYLGKMGLEREYDSYLKGEDGGLQVEVNSLGRRIRVIESQDYVAGNNLALTIDSEVQQLAEEALGELTGAVVVMDPRDGDVLAAVSHPAFDPNQFIGGISSENWQKLSADERHPLLNRVVGVQYPPGSIYKIVTAVAGLAEGVITPQSTIFCGGGLQFGDRYYRCWKRDGHGSVDLNRAITESCDTYFYVLGEKLGIDTIARYARLLGLGQVTGIGLAGEAGGLVPDTAWKRRTKGRSWYAGETLSAAIGQGYNLMTPIQMAVMVSTVANGGQLHRPRIVRSVTGADGSVIREFPPQSVPLEIPAEVFDAVRRGMWGVVNAPGGTGGRARVAEVDVAGKTGTAQVIGIKDRDENSSQDFLPEKYRDHAWFAGFAPFGAPMVTLVVLAEHGGHGGSVSAPVAQKIIRGLVERGYFPGTKKGGG